MSTATTHIGLRQPELQVTGIELIGQQITAALDRNKRLVDRFRFGLDKLQLLQGDFTTNHIDIINLATILYSFDKRFSKTTMQYISDMLNGPDSKCQYFISSHPPQRLKNKYNCRTLQTINKFTIKTVQSGEAHKLYLMKRTVDQSNQ